MMLNLAALAELTGARLEGDPSRQVDHIDTLRDGKQGSVVFLSNKKYVKNLADTKASVVILEAAFADQCPVDKLVSENPYLDYARVAAVLNPEPELVPGIAATAVIDETAIIDDTSVISAGVVIGAGTKIDAKVSIGANSVIGNDVKIGAGTRLHANVTICDGSIIGKDCLLHPGAVIGSDGFGLAKDKGCWVRIPQLGIARLGDNVDIGANSAVDRGAIKDTVIADGVKIDNQVQVAHNVTIGENTAIAAQVGISGSTKIGKQCTIAGASGLAGHLTLVDNVHISAKTGVMQSYLEPGLYTGVMPAMPHREWQKNAARLRRLDELAKKVRDLEKQLSNQQLNQE